MRKYLLLLLLFAMSCTLANAQSDTVRYVKPTDKGGAYANDGKSWDKAKDNIQDAINDLRTYMTQQGLHSGSVYVAAGTYEPTEGVEGGASGQLSTSFIIYPGIHVYGGFNPDQPEGTPAGRVLVSDDKKQEMSFSQLQAGDTTVVRWQMKYPSILSGNHNHNAEGSFTWNPTRKRYDTRFPGNSYHVVYFATNGFIVSNEHPGYADSLTYEARLDGFTVQDGNASGASDVRQGRRDHTAMGGGIYMVKNSVVENCIIQRCQAAMRGGGVYMDGGGRLIHSLVRECQTLGSGVSGGLGGGVCIDNNGEVRRSWITRNVARMGGGAAIVSYPELHPRGAEGTYLRGSFDPYMAATLVTSNTSTTEAGGIYLDRGGVVNHVTVARNENAGRDISYGRTRYGRSGGVYIYGAGQVYNSVIWGNRCDANNDIQYAATTGVSIPSYVSLKQPFVGYTALNNLDITDFTGTARLDVYSFETSNNDPDRSGNFTLFQAPPDTAGAGISARRLAIWYPFSKTSLATKAVQLQADYSSQAFSVMSIARQDFFDKQYEPISTLGAIETGIEEIETARVKPANPADGTDPIPTIFVDPNRVLKDPSQKSGASWENPLENISEAIQYFRENMPASGKFQILVKQGSMTCAGVGAYYAPEASRQSVVNLASIRMIPNLLLYGGYPSSLTGTSTEGRNPKNYPTRISADIIGAGYNYNAMHVVSFSMAHDAVIDGFQLYYGNSQRTQSETLARGGGIVVGNEFYPLSTRVDMTGNVARNCVIANCSGIYGAAVFAGGSYERTDGNATAKVKAALTMENCVIHNNESPNSIIHASGDATITMDHCTVIGNVGPLLVTSKYGSDDTEGTISVSNSVFHANAKDNVADVNNITSADIPSLRNSTRVTGTNNIIDILYTQQYDGFDKLLGYDAADAKTYPAFANPVRNAGVARNTADNSVYGGTPDFTPTDMNPVVNRASATGEHTAWGTDLTTEVSRDYGGAPDVGALECHQASATDNTDGGQPTFGSVIYVRDYNTYDQDGNLTNTDVSTDNRDGSTWTRAINGNGQYDSEAASYSYSSASSVQASTSVSAAEYRYKLSVGNTGRYALGNISNTQIRNTTTQGDGDDFVFVSAGDNTYYIYDVTRTSYVVYTNTNPGGGNVLLSTDNTKGATWHLHDFGSGNYGIIPGELDDSESQPGWNYYGGVETNALGLYRISDANSQWKLWLRTASTTSQQVNGLQYAVDKAAATEGNDKPEVWVGEGYYTNKSTDKVNRQNYAYRMAEGVNVFGGFPGYGNPSMNERSPKQYVSVLQPQTVDPTDLNSDLIVNSSASVARVLVQPEGFSTETKWDGFTIRYGYLHSTYQRNIQGDISRINTSNIGTAGGAGAYLMENGVLENCELLNNTILVYPNAGDNKLDRIPGNDDGTASGGFHQAGGGVYITTKSPNGNGGTLRNCVVAGNLLLHKFSKPLNPESVWMYGAGVYQDKGIIYNTIIRDNTMKVIEGDATAGQSNSNTNEVLVGAGAFLVSGQFYNNTIVHNTAQSFGNGSNGSIGHAHHILIPGIYVYSSITMYNSIVSDNTSVQNKQTKDVNGGNNNKFWFDLPVCYFDISGSGATALYNPSATQVKVNYSYIDITLRNGNGYNSTNLCYQNDTGNTNIYLDSNKGTAHTPNYTSDKIYDATTYRLASGSPCINEGTDAIDGVTIPSYDAGYADRVQDCTIDIGAYEYNGAEDITPRDTTELHRYYDLNGNPQTETRNVADYFVTQNGSGNASANSPANAACANKLQRVLDAAGRYKYQHPETHVVVRLEALPDSAGYTPTRSAATTAAEATNPRSYSIILPLGVELQGGWKLNDNFGIDEDGNLNHRDPINNVTRLTGEYTSGTEKVNVYHVVTITNQVFDENGTPTGQLLSETVKTSYPFATNPPTPVGNKDFDRAKLDGLYIEGGRANGTREENQRGAAAVLPSYSLVSDCIVRDNEATGYGGAFYMLPGSVVEGCVLEQNRAAYGGAVAVEEVTTSTTDNGLDSTLDNEIGNDTGNEIGSISDNETGNDLGNNALRPVYALLLSNTITRNTATSRGGGLWFNTNARTLNSVYWLNTSAEQNDISGITTTENEQVIINCPVNFCAVTNQALPGNNNISISPTNDNGVRWGKDVNLNQKHDYDFYLPSRASVLSRAGIPYVVMRTFLRFLPGVDSLDLAGVSRLEYTEDDYKGRSTAYDGEPLVVKMNDNMEIGARALNQNFSITIDPDHPLYRLFVAHPENMQANLANAMMESSDPYYKQQGSSFANPFLRLTDALAYVIDARKRYPDISRNHRFEIFMAPGTYYPMADLVGDQQNVRTHTFIVPEMVTLIGGVDARNNLYCQDTLNTENPVITSGNSTITLKGASTDSIRLNRQRFDLNQNSIVEPWEMRNATVLSGFTEGSDLRVKNVYHVITSIADPNVVGQQPDMKDDKGNIVTDRDKESFYSRGRRAIIIDGLTVTEGSAMNYESSVRNKQMYYRGGGIFIAGSYLNPSTEDVTGASDMSLGQHNTPLVVSNSLFQNNQARLGGAIFSDGAVHVVGSSFVQNLAVSPSSTDTEDLQNVTFSGGGAIATNAEVFATNTIFANNEARDGGGSIVIDENGTNKRSNSYTIEEVDSAGKTTTESKTANDIRGYGGMIWAGTNGAVRLVNCNSVRNKAHAYASIYNCTPNTTASGTGHPHFGINCVFWGNQVDAGQDSLLMNYNKQSAIGGLYFSAYQEGKGLPVTVTPNTPDSIYQQKIIENGYADLFNLDEILGHANHNIIISDNNDAVDGPNFTLPSNEAGIDGYLPSADWVPSRINSLCDAGWGSINQTTDGEFVKEKNIDLDNRVTWFINGMYGMLADFYMREFNLTLLPQGDEKYMMYADENGDESTRNMTRISADPLGTVTRDYIDIGVYEYQHARLHIANGDEVDELWVSDSETTGSNDGRTPHTPTSDLQRAIQTLLLSRNNHPKIIHMLEGTYSPLYEQDNGNIGFQIHTLPNPSTVALRDTIVTGQGYQATSLTIMGGYSKDIEGLRDVSRYPTILKMNRRDNASVANTAHLFYIGDAEQWETSGAISGESTGTTASIKETSVTKTSVSHGKAMPIVLDGLTFFNPYANPQHRDLDANGKQLAEPFNGTYTAGAAIYYREQFKSESTSFVQGNNNPPTKTTEHLEATGGAPKLTIRNCRFTQNGLRGAADDYTVPAVYIGAGGGKTLIYNSIFDNNTGAPIIATDATDIVNCTFAENGGHLTAAGDGTASSLSNSIIWRDDTAQTNTTQYEGFVADSLHNNAITGIQNTVESENNHNVGLSATNADPMQGPNFVRATAIPGQTLDFRINPGMRTLNRGDSTIYKRLTAVVARGVKVKGDDNVEREILKPDNTWRYDLSWGDRIYDNGLDRGAYECRVEQRRVLYVIPTKTTGTMTGTSWENAYGQGQLQTAVDAAAIYAFSHTSTGNKKTRAYVLVKGEANNTSAENTLTLRDGVSVYGSIPDTYLSSINDTRANDNSQLSAYLDSMLVARPGIAARSARRSRVQGLRTLDDSYSNGSLVDGFEVRAAVAQTDPVVDITKPVVLRKLIIHDNTVTGSGHTVVNMQQGLMYNSLVYANTPGDGQPTMQLGHDAAVINSTIVSNTAGVTAIDGEGLLANSITFGFAAGGLSGDVSRGTALDTLRVNSVSGIPFAPYLTPGVNPYTLPTYITDYAPYQYQLNESANDVAGGVSLDKILEKAQADRQEAWEVIKCAQDSGWIGFSTDRDLLGNNRLLGNLIDRGCFETWRIRQDDHISATADNYPHEGSVVYLMENASLNIGTRGGEQIFTSDNPFRPAFLLMRPRASLYGNGNVIRASYVAVDRQFSPTEKYALVSLPFSYRASDLLRTEILPNGQINGVRYKMKKVQTYDGSRRARWNYHFSEDDSECWTDLDTDRRLPPNTGWLATLPDTTEAYTLRLVGYGEADGDYVYTEDGSPKTITLTQHDYHPADGSAHFTKEENMGWNIGGLPYLVSNYKLGSTSSSTYPMHVPHVIYEVNADGRFTTQQSWADDAVLSSGDGFMTQTATNAATETVTFALPYQAEDGSTATTSKGTISVGDEETEDELQLNVSSEAKALNYSLGNDGVKWLPLERDSVAIYALSAGGTPMSLASATPVDVDIPLVVTGRLTDNTTVSLPDTAGFGSVSHVWLRDDASGRVVDLKDEAMQLSAVATDSLAAHTRSLTLRLGDRRPDGSHATDGSHVRIYLTGRTLHVDGLKAGSRVAVYTVSGKLYSTAVANSDTYTRELQPGVFIVRAGGKGQAVGVK